MYAAEFRVQFEVGELVAERDGHRGLRYRNEELSLNLIVAAFKEFLEYVEYRVLFPERRALTWSSTQLNRNLSSISGHVFSL